MSSIFTGWCCCLVRAIEEAEVVPINTRQSHGTVVELSGLPLDVQQRNKQFPGLAKVKNITTTYALVTCHSLIPGSAYLKQWKFSEASLGSTVAKRTLNKFVSGVVSCCGKDSFLTPGATAGVEHGGGICNLGLNFTILFLNERFKQEYCAHYGFQPKPLSLSVSQCKADIDLICQCLPQIHCQLEQVPFGGSTGTVQVGASPISSGSFEVIATSVDGKISLSAVELNEETHVQREPSSHSQSKTSLAQEITTFERVKVVQCKGSESTSHLKLDMGMPLVYVSADTRLIGVLTGGGRALTLSMLFQLLQGMDFC